MTIAELEVLHILDGLPVSIYGSRNECDLCPRKPSYQLYSFIAPVVKIFRCTECIKGIPKDIRDLKSQDWLLEEL